MGFMDNLRRAAEVEGQTGEIGKIKEEVNKGVPSAIQRIISSAGEQNRGKARAIRDQPRPEQLLPFQTGSNPPARPVGPAGTRIIGADGQERTRKPR